MDASARIGRPNDGRHVELQGVPQPAVGPAAKQQQAAGFGVSPGHSCQPSRLPDKQQLLAAAVSPASLLTSSSCWLQPSKLANKQQLLAAGVFEHQHTRTIGTNTKGWRGHLIQKEQHVEHRACFMGNNAKKKCCRVFEGHRAGYSLRPNP
eukprot:1160915-Pelagomonas_calceolata.AAC.22